MIYDIFQPVAEATMPEGQTFKADLIYKDGTHRDDQELNRWTLKDNPNLLAVRFHKPDPIKAMVPQVADKMAGWDRAPANVNWIRECLHAVNELGLLKVDGQPSADPDAERRAWLEKRMDELGIVHSVSRECIRRWFFNPKDNPTCDSVLDSNAILTKMESGSGFAVVLPTGHTIAYTTAKKIWATFTTDIPDPYLENRPKVGEYLSRNTWNYTRHRLTIEKTGVRVGCQFIPRKAIEAFAKQEGWSK